MPGEFPVINKEKLLASAQKSLQKGQVAKAIKDYRKIVESDPRDVRNRQKLAELYVRAQKPEDALEHYESVASYYADNGFYLKAIAVYKQMQRVEPSRIEIYHRLAELNAKQGLVGNALAEYKGLVARYEKEGLLSDALNVLKKMKDIDPDNLNIRVKIADTCARIGQRDRGLEELRAMVERLREKGDTGKLLKLYDIFLPMFPDEVDLRSGQARALVDHGDVGRGLAQFEDLAQQHPGRPDVLQNLAYAARVKGDTAVEMRALSALLEQQPDDLRVREAFARVLLKADQPEKALENLEDWKDDFLDAQRSDLLKEFYESLRESGFEDPRIIETLRHVYQVRGEGDKLLDLVGPGEFSSGDEESFNFTQEQDSVFEEDADSDQIEDLPPEFIEADSEESDETEVSEEEGGDVELELELDGDPFADLKPAQSPESEDLPALEPDRDNELEMIELPDLDFDEEPSSGAQAEEIAGPDDDDHSGGDDFSDDELPDLAFDLDDAFGDLTGEMPSQEDTGSDEQETAADVSPVPRAEASISSKEKSRLEGEFSRFKKSVESQIDESDAETHFNLGIAYKEMGLFEDAVGEFNQAMKNAGRRTDALTLKGVCLKEKADFDGALLAFEEALSDSSLDSETRCNLYFETGLLQESRQKPEAALEAFEKVAEIDPFFRGANGKIAQLRSALGIKDDTGGDDGRVSYV
jgi:tetratricopeptide (TPR) repeat protein